MNATLLPASLRPPLAAIVCAAVVCLWSASTFAQAAPEDAWGAFNRFCVRYFGAEKEPELYRWAGADLKTVDSGAWRHVSESSACIAWETNLPAKTHVRYGLTAEYGRKTAEPERPFFLHVHYLKGLEPDKTYHYQLVSVDERGRTVASPDMTFTTKRLEKAVRIPDDLPGGPPYVCDKPDTTYLVTKDITSDTTCVNVVANGITLDLGGHTLVFDNKAGAEDATVAIQGYGWHPSQKSCGVRTADGRTNLRVVNGVIRQGAGQGYGGNGGFNPVFLRRPRNTEIAGITADYEGVQITGIRVMNGYEGVEVHHNALLDRGTKIVNRHQGCDAIAFGIGEAREVSKCHHNLIKRTRHRGIATVSNTSLYANEIYVDSFATNSYGIMYYSKAAQRLSLVGNRIFGAGFHPIGIGSGQRWSDVVVRANYIQIQGVERDERWTGGDGGGEEGTVGPGGFHAVNGIRLQRPDRNVLHEKNVIVVKGFGEGCQMRGLWITPDDKTADGIVLRENIVKVIAQDQKAEGYAVTAGGAGHTGEPPVVLEGNTLISNLTNVQFNDNYSHGGRFRFVKNTLAKVDGDARYRTVRVGWGGRAFDSFGHEFLDNRFEDGASIESVSFDGATRNRYGFVVEHVLTVKAAPGAMVLIKDKTGGEAFSGMMPTAGVLTVPLAQYEVTQKGKEARTPHQVSVTHEEKVKTVDVTMDRDREIAAN